MNALRKPVYRFPRPQFVYDNIHSMKQIRIANKLSLAEVSRDTLIPTVLLDDWENNFRYPSKNNYNKLAAFFEWEIWN